MSELIATILDTTGIQSYIFNSNRLRENIGASYLVEQATKEWVREILESLTEKTYFPDEVKDKPEARPYIDNDIDDLSAEVIYAAGGNTVLLFRTLELAIEFTKRLSSRALRKAPGLNIVAAHQSFNWKTDNLSQIIDNLINTKLDQKKNVRRGSAPLLGLGVTVDCTSTRLVAIGRSDQFGAPEDGSYWVSREVKYKLKAVDLANKSLQKIFQDIVPEMYQFPLQFDHLGRSMGESSYVAVVHADGNSMGERFKRWGKNRGNRDYITRMRELSWSVNRAGINALKAVGQAIVQSIHSDDSGETIHSRDSQDRAIGKLTLSQQPHLPFHPYLPFRPLVYGGDDVTFVCDGRLGLTLAALYLKAFEDQEAADGEKLTACAGVSIVKAHYPFARSYELSESLCQNAKKLVRNVTPTSALDWHIAASGLLGSLNEIRQREYQVPEGRLHLRPLWLKTDQGSWRNWQGFQSVIADLIIGDHWRDRRNKVIGLREELRQGADATKKFLSLYGLSQKALPPFSSANDDLAVSGWTDITEINSEGKSDGIRICGYFDAIEAMEFYFPLPEATP